MFGAVMVTSCASSHEQIAPSEGVAPQPNILFILLDDLGKEWVPLYSEAETNMPNLQQLAAEGMIFENAYVNPQCTPTRVSLLTGQYPFRHGWVNHWDTPRWGHGYFDPEQNPSLPRLLQAEGYRTVAVGKWQINDFRVTPDAMKRVGFDDYLMWTGYQSGDPPSAQRYWDPYVHSNTGSATVSDAFSEDLFADFILNFVAENGDAPWFAYYAMNLPHFPLTTVPGMDESASARDKWRAMIEYTDVVLGRLLIGLTALGERDDTIIVWLTDNGSTGRYPGEIDGRMVRGGKGRTSESGVNVPLIVSAPNLSSGDRTDALVDITDFLPTFVDLAGGELPEDHTIDGQSFATWLSGEAADTTRQWIMAMGGRNEAEITSAGVQNAYVFRDRVLRDKRYKVYVSPSPNAAIVKMVDLQTDPSELHNILDLKDANAQSSLAKFQAIVDSFPETDNDPRYSQRPIEPWAVPIETEADTWKK